MMEYTNASYAEISPPKEKQPDTLRVGHDVNSQAERCIGNGAKGGLSLYYRQTQEKKLLERKYGKATDIRWENGNDTIKVLERAKSELYATFGIHEHTENNSLIGKFQKGVVDGLIVDNVDFAKQVMEQGIDTVVKALLEVLGSFEKIKNLVTRMAEELSEQVQNIANLNPYDSGKLLGWMGFGIIGSLGRSIGKNAIKSELKHVTKKPHAPHKNPLDGTDFLEMKGTYKVDIATAKVSEMWEKMNKFKEVLDAKHLANHPQRLETMLDIIESMTIYIETNAARIKTMSPKDLKKFQDDFESFKNAIIPLTKDTHIPRQSRDTIDLFRTEKFTSAYNAIMPKQVEKIPQKEIIYKPSKYDNE